MAEWANVQYNGASVGTLYYDDAQDKLGFVVTVSDPAAVPGYGTITNLIKAALLASRITAEDCYFGILGSLDKREGFSYESGSGELVKPEPDFSGLVQDEIDQLPSPYFIRLNEDDEVVSLVQNLGDDLSVRENGDWVEPTDSNYPDNGNYFIEFVSEDAISEYDRIVNENKAPVLTDFKVIPSDD